MTQGPELPLEVLLGDGTAISIERVPYRDLPFLIRSVAANSPEVKVELSSGDNAREHLCVHISERCVALYLVESSQLHVLDTITLEHIGNLQITRHDDVRSSLRRARFHVSGDWLVFENEKNIFRINSRVVERLDIEYLYPKQSVVEVTSSTVIIDDGGESLEYPIVSR